MLWHERWRQRVRGRREYFHFLHNRYDFSLWGSWMLPASSFIHQRRLELFNHQRTLHQEQGYSFLPLFFALAIFILLSIPCYILRRVWVSSDAPQHSTLGGCLLLPYIFFLGKLTLISNSQNTLLSSRSLDPAASWISPLEYLPDTSTLKVQNWPIVSFIS